MVRIKANSDKVAWSGRILAVQPRIRLMRSFDERSHSYLGYVLRVEGMMGEEPGVFMIALGKAAQAKHQFKVGMEVKGLAVPVPDPQMETAGFYKASGLKVLKDAERGPGVEPSFLGEPPGFDISRSRGHRRLAAKTYDSKCSGYIWEGRMPVVMVVDHWNPQKKRFRFETFCYGPKNCSLYRSGPIRKVPGRKGMSYTEEDWVDESDTAHRRPDE